MAASFKRGVLMAIGALLLGSGVASADSSGFVLFGKPNPDANIPPEQQVVHPVTDPYFHEDSTITTDLRAWFVYHDFPAGGVINGGSAKVYAVQARLALTNSLQLVAYKDGYTDFDSGLTDASGWNDVAAGLKWAPIQDWKNQFHLAVGAGYELPIGDHKAFQNDGELRLWASVDKGFGPLHLGGTINYFYNTSRDNEEPLGYSDTISWHLRADYYVCKQFSPVVEVNGYHAINKHHEVVPVSGIDVTNFGGGDDVVTLGLGGEFRLIDHVALRAAYELPLTSGEDLYGWRLTFSAVISF